MRVAVVCPYDLGAKGGVQDQAVALVRWLQDDGHDAYLVGPGSDVPAGAVGVGPVTVVSANGSATPITLSPSAWRATAAAVAGADVIHVHEPFMPVVSQAAAFAGPIPKVGTFHADPTRMIRRLYRVAGPVLRRITARLAVATAVSPVAAGALRGIARVRIVPNGIEVGSFATGPKRAGRVAFLGRDDPRKGLDVLLEAWPMVRRRVSGAELVVAGARREPLEGVRFLGRVGEAEKRRVLTEAEVFCAPNTGGESFGIVLAEAMASGCALVASALPAFVSLAGDAARFVRAGDPVGLAGALAGLLADDDARRSAVESGLARVGAFDRRRVLDGYLDAYSAALARSN